MRTPEQKLWDRTRPRFQRAGLFVERIENVANEGNFDLHYLTDAGASGWVELKAVSDWPAWASTPVLHKYGLSRSQRNWALNYRKHGGRLAYALVGVGRDILLFGGSRLDHLNTYAAAEFRAAACADNWVDVMRRLGEGSE